MFLIISIFAILCSCASPSSGWDPAVGIPWSKWKAFCEVNSDWIAANQCPYDATGTFDVKIGIYVKLPGATSDRHLTYVGDLPYVIIAEYLETYCKFKFTLFWFTVCDATLCPNMTAGLYVTIQVTSNEIIIPGPLMRNARQEYTQVYDTPPAPGNPDQNNWTAIHISVDTHWCNGWYKDQSGEVAYEEQKTRDVAHQHFIYSSQSHVPSEDLPGFRRMSPWVYIDAWNTTLPAYAAYALAQYNANLVPCSNYTAGKCAYMIPLFSSKRSEGISEKRDSLNQLDGPSFTLDESEYDAIHAAAVLAQTHNVKQPHM